MKGVEMMQIDKTSESYKKLCNFYICNSYSVSNTFGKVTLDDVLENIVRVVTEKSFIQYKDLKDSICSGYFSHNILKKLLDYLVNENLICSNDNITFRPVVDTNMQLNESNTKLIDRIKTHVIDCLLKDQNKDKWLSFHQIHDQLPKQKDKWCFDRDFKTAVFELIDIGIVKGIIKSEHLFQIDRDKYNASTLGLKESTLNKHDYNISTPKIKESILDYLRDSEEYRTEDEIVNNLLGGPEYESCDIDFVYKLVQSIRVCLQDLLADPSLIVLSAHNSVLYDNVFRHKYAVEVEDKVLDCIRKGYPGCLSFDFLADSCNTSVWETGYILQRLIDDEKVERMDDRDYRYRGDKIVGGVKDDLKLDNAIDNVSKIAKQDLGVRGDRDLYRVSYHIIDLLNKFKVATVTRNYLFEYLSSYKISVEVLGILIKEGVVIENSGNLGGISFFQYNRDIENNVFDSVKNLCFNKGAIEFTIDDLKQVDDCNNLSGYAIKCYLHALEDRRGLVTYKGNNNYSMVVEPRIKEFEQLAKDRFIEASKYYIDGSKVEDLDKGIANSVNFQQVQETKPCLPNHYCKVCGSKTGCMHSREKQVENDN
ncbi:MAG: hypothetical protein ACXACY_27170 [Candidatus Hodarchaeales archaeon]|jgi:hypothetical protein